MHRKEIKYVGFYDVLDSQSDRVSNLAAINKMNYISDALVEAGYDVKFISPSWMGNETEKKIEKQTTIEIDENKQVVFCPSWKTKNKFTKNIKVIFSLMWLFFYLLFTTQKNEKVLAYHVQWISFPIRAAKFFKKFDLILEVEEIYQDVIEYSEIFIKWENKLINKADAFLYSTDLLEKKVGSHKPSIVIYGEYKKYPKLAEPPKNGKIRLLYAGIIDKHKKGAFNALEASKFLSNDYELHIIGFGEIERLQAEISKHNKNNGCLVYYDGIKSGEEYIKYCQTFGIGLSTQAMEGEYLESSFPSKVLSYLSLGLRVVSGNIKCVTESKIGSLITYYAEDSPQKIAEAIEKVDMNSEYNGREIIEKLHKEFVIDIRELIEKNNTHK